MAGHPVSHRITIELEAAAADFDTPALAQWIGHALTKEGQLGIVVTRLDVEQEDGP